MELNQMEERLAMLDGPDGFSAFESDLDKLESKLKDDVASIHSQLRAIEVVKRLFKSHRKAWGVSDGSQDTQEAQTAPVQVEAAQERLERLKNNQCTYKGKGEKWCARKLTTKAEQESGYCAIHMNELGLSEKEPETKPAPKAKRRSKPRKTFGSK